MLGPCIWNEYYSPSQGFQYGHGFQNIKRARMEKLSGPERRWNCLNRMSVWHGRSANLVVLHNVNMKWLKMLKYREWHVINVRKKLYKIKFQEKLI